MSDTSTPAELMLGQVVFFQSYGSKQAEDGTLLFCEGVGDFQARGLPSSANLHNSALSQCLFRVEACTYERGSLLLANRSEINRRSKGSPVRYGDTIQLCHMYSNNYLSFSPSSRFLSGHLQVEVVAEPTERSWFTIVSASHAYASGSPVLLSHQIRLSANVELVLHYVTLGLRLRVVGSDQPFEWSLSMLDNWYSGEHEIRVLMPMCLHHNQLGLSVSAMHSEESTASFRRVKDWALTRHRAAADLLVPSTSEQKGVLSGFDIDGKSYWRIEAADQTASARIAFSGKYFLRNIYTQKYLSMSLSIIAEPTQADAFTIRPRHVKSLYLLDGTDVEILNSEGKLLAANKRAGKMFHGYGFIPAFQPEELQLDGKCADLELRERTKDAAVTTFEVRGLPGSMAVAVLQIATASSLLKTFLEFLAAASTGPSQAEEILDFESRCELTIKTVTRLLAILTDNQGDQKRRLQNLMAGMDIHLAAIQIIHRYHDIDPLARPAAGHTADLTTKTLIETKHGDSLDTKSLRMAIGYSVFEALVNLLSALADGNAATSACISEFYEDLCIAMPLNVKAVGPLLIAVFRLADLKISNYASFFSDWVSRLSTLTAANSREQCIWLRLLRFLAEEQGRVNPRSQAELSRLLLTGPDALRLIQVYRGHSSCTVKFLGLKGDVGTSVDVKELKGGCVKYLHRLMMLLYTLCRQDNVAACVEVRTTLGLSPEVLIEWLRDARLPLPLREATVYLTNVLIIEQSGFSSYQELIANKVFKFSTLESLYKEYQSGKETRNDLVTECSAWTYRLWSTYDSGTELAALPKKVVASFTCAAISQVTVLLDKGGPTKLFVESMKMSLTVMLASLNNTESSAAGRRHWTVVLRGLEDSELKLRLTQMVIQTLKFIFEIELHFQVCDLLCTFKRNSQGSFKNEEVQSLCKSSLEPGIQSRISTAVKHKLANELSALANETERGLIANERQDHGTNLFFNHEEYLRLLAELLFASSDSSRTSVNDLSGLLGQSLNAGSALARRLSEVALVISSQETADLADVETFAKRLALIQWEMMAGLVDTFNLHDVLMNLLRLVQRRRHESLQSLNKMQDLFRNLNMLPQLMTIWQALPKERDLSHLVVTLLFHLTFANTLSQSALNALMEGWTLDIYDPLCPWLMEQVQRLKLLTSTQRSALISSLLKQIVRSRSNTHISGLNWILCAIGSSKAVSSETQIIAASRIIEEVQKWGLDFMEPGDQLCLGKLMTLLAHCCQGNPFVAAQCRSFMPFSQLHGLLEGTASEVLLQGLWSLFDSMYASHPEADFSTVLASIAAFITTFSSAEREHHYAQLTAIAEQGLYELVFPADNPELVDLTSDPGQSAAGWKLLASGDFWEPAGGVLALLGSWLKRRALKPEVHSFLRSIHSALHELHADLLNLEIQRSDLRFGLLLERLAEVLKDMNETLEHQSTSTGQESISLTGKLMFARALAAPMLDAKEQTMRRTFTLDSGTVGLLQKLAKFRKHCVHLLSSEARRKQGMDKFVAITRSIYPFHKLSSHMSSKDLGSMTKAVSNVLTNMDESQLAVMFQIFKRLFSRAKERRVANSVAFKSGLLVTALRSVVHFSHFKLSKSALAFLNCYLLKQTTDFQNQFLQLLISSELYFSFFLSLRDHLNMCLANVNDLSKLQRSNILTSILSQFNEGSFEPLSKYKDTEQSKSEQIGFCRRLVRFTKLCCDNCHLPFQEFMNNQQESMADQMSAERSSLNVVSTIAVFVIHIVEKAQKVQELTAEIAATCLDALADYVTGPCARNQLCLGSDLQFVIALNRLYTEAKQQPHSAKWVEVCDMVVLLFLTLLEGSPDPVVIHTLTSYADLNMLHTHMREIYEKYICHSRDALLFHRQPKIPNADIPYDTLPALVSLGFNLFRFLITLKGLAPSIALSLQAPESSMSTLSLWDRLKLGKIGTLVSFDSGYLEFYESFTGYVEVARNDKIEVAYFQIPWKCKFLTDKTRESIVLEANRNSQQEKIEHFLKMSNLCAIEMNHQISLYSRFSLKAFSRGWEIYGQISFLLILAINVILLVTVTDQSSLTLSSTYEPSIIVVSVLGSFQFLFAVLGHAAYLIEYYPNIVYSEKLHLPVIEFSDYPLISHNDSLLMRHVNEHFDLIILEGSGKCLSVLYILTNMETLYFVLFIAASAVAFWNPFWYCILLLDVIKRSLAVKNILMSITLNWKQLIVTTIFGLFIIFIFATIGFTYFNEYYSETDAQFVTYCSTLYECFFSTLNLGIRMGGGIGDALVSPKIGNWNYWQRVVFDIAFFVIVIIIILNVIFGIIIDTFAELRDKRQALESDMKNNCYICGTLRSTLELQGQGWAKHFLVEHSPLAYLAFIIYLREKEMIECNGLEKFVKEKLQTFNTSFFPTTSKYLQDHK